MDEDEQDDLNKKSDIMKVIESKITKLADKFCEIHVLPKLTAKEEMGSYDLSVLAQDRVDSDIVLYDDYDPDQNKLNLDDE